MLRLYASDPAYQDVDRVADWIAKLKNPQCWQDLRDMPELERVVMLKDLEDLFWELTH